MVLVLRCSTLSNRARGTFGFDRGMHKDFYLTFGTDRPPVVGAQAILLVFARQRFSLLRSCPLFLERRKPYLRICRMVQPVEGTPPSWGPHGHVFLPAQTPRAPSCGNSRARFFSPIQTPRRVCRFDSLVVEQGGISVTRERAGRQQPKLALLLRLLLMEGMKYAAEQLCADVPKARPRLGTSWAAHCPDLFTPPLTVLVSDSSKKEEVHVYSVAHT